MKKDEQPATPSRDAARARAPARWIEAVRRAASRVPPSKTIPWTWFLLAFAIALGTASRWVPAPVQKTDAVPYVSTVTGKYVLRRLDAQLATPEEVDGLRARLEVERLADDVVVRSTLRNDGAQRLTVSWPGHCGAGSTFYRDGPDGVFFRAVRFEPAAGYDSTEFLHDGERMYDGFGVPLEPGDEIVDAFSLKEVDAACRAVAVDRTGHELGDPTTIARVFVGYDVAVTHPEWEGRMNPDGRRKVAQRSTWRFVIDSITVPTEIAAHASLLSTPRWSRPFRAAPLPSRNGDPPPASAAPPDAPRPTPAQLAQIEGRIEYFGGFRWREIVERSGVRPDLYPALRAEVLGGVTHEERFGEAGAPGAFQRAVAEEMATLRKHHAMPDSIGPVVVSSSP